MYHLKKFAVPFFAAVLLIGASLACGSSDSTSPTAPVPTEPEQEQPSTPPQPTNTPKPTDTPEPTATPEPTDTPEPTVPTYSEPVVLAEIEGAGETVTDNFEWPACQKAVFYWTAFPSNYGSASLIAHLHKTSVEQSVSLVNEFAMNVSTEGFSGSALQPLSGGEYYLSTENTDEPWAIRVECQDGVAPVGTGIDLQAAGNVVTGNYELPECQKSVFVWSTEPDDSGSASLILKLCGNECTTLVNEFDMDLTAPLEGEALQALGGGVYYLVSKNTSGRPWSVRWECRD